ncbi:MAG: DUF3794 domain-containing protein [Bacillota bacterium]|nr:DUF3794 domain-containing protein [Bacillota bacterium]
MSNDLIVKRRLLKVEKVIGEDTVRRTVAADVVLPFKVLKVFDVIAHVMAVETAVQEGGVRVAGVVHKQLFVVDRGDIVRHVEEDIPFEFLVPVEGVLPGMNVQTNIRILEIDKTLVDPQTVRQVIVLEIFVKVTVTKQIEVVVDVRGKDIIVKKELLKVDSVVGEDTVSQVITPVATLPIVARKIFRIIPSVRNVTAEVRTDTVIVRGVIHKQVFLVDEGDLVRHVSEDIPFTNTIAIPGARPGMDVQFDVSVFLEEFKLIDPPSRMLRQVLTIEAFVKVTETLQIEVVIDVKGRNIVVKRKLLKVESVVVDVLQQETVRAVVRLPVQAIKIFDIMASIVNLQAEARFDQVVVRGILHKQLFFVDPGGLVRHEREDIPFTFVKSAPGARPGMNVQVRARIIGDIRARIIDNKGLEIEQVAVIEIFAKVTRTVQLEVVVDVKRVLPPPKPSNDPQPSPES